MPKKKVQVNTIDEEIKVEVDENATEEEVLQAAKESSKHVCGHVNEHSLGIDGKPDKPKCDLPSGHNGSHSGVHKQNIPYEEAEFINGIERVIKRVRVEDVRSEWGDMAGIPADKIPTPPEIKPPSMQTLHERMLTLEGQMNKDA